MFRSTVERDLFRTNFHKKQHFAYKNDVPMLLDCENANEKPAISPSLPGVKYESKVGNVALQLRIPDWIAFNNQILRFEAIGFGDQGQFLKGKQAFFKILYFLEDDSIQVVEASAKNDDRFRGTILKRHRIPKSVKEGRTYYSLDDLNIGKEVEFYGAKYRIYSCDKYTRDYLTDLGIQVPHDEENLLPVPASNKCTQERAVTCRPIRPHSHPFKQFLKYDGSVLQFHCAWVQPEKVGKLFEPLLLLYYLADDSIEIRQMSNELSSHDGGQRLQNGQQQKTKILVRRAKIPKHRPIEPLPGLHLKKDLSLNPDLDYFTDKDLKMGSTIDAWGRQLLIYDCDDFTKKFLAVKYGLGMAAIRQFQVQPLRLEEIFPDPQPVESRKMSIRRKTDRNNPLPPPPLIADRGRPQTSRDFVKFMTRDRSQSQSHILRFLAVLRGTGNEARRFVISYHLVDDTISVYEKPQRNSGYRGGRFMDRCHIRKLGPNSNGYVLATDLTIGADICLNGHWFQILDADDYALSYMEKHADEFPASNRLEILRKLRSTVGGQIRDLKDLFSKNDLEGRGSVDRTVFRNVLRQMVPHDSLNAQEIVTLERSYYLEGPNTESRLLQLGYPEGISSIGVLQKELKTAQFSDFRKLLQYLQQHDTAGYSTGLLSEERILRHCLAYPLPAKKHHIAEVLQRFKTNEGEVGYHEFVKAIDWKTNPAVSLSELGFELASSSRINYKRLITDIEDE